MTTERNHEPARALEALADQLRSEDTPIAPHVVDPTEPPQLGELTGSADHAFVIEAVREGYLLHYEQPRLLAGHDADLALLAGDYLYALGLDRLATLGDTRAVAILSDLITTCARLQAEGDVDPVPALWRSAAAQIAAPR
jgi:hypothetical protein